MSACEAAVNLGDSEYPAVVECGAPCPRDVCPFAERVVAGACRAGSLPEGQADG